MTRTSSPKHDGAFAGRSIAVLIISASVLLTGTVFGYAAATIHDTDTSANIYGSSHLMAPLTDASLSATTETAAVSPSAVSNSMAPLTVSTSTCGSSQLNGPLT